MNLHITRDQRDPAKVLLLLDGKVVARLPHQLALEAAKQLRQTAKQAEEYDNANKVIYQDALLIRSGAPFRLSLDSKIRDEALKEAQWDPKARKEMPMDAGRIRGAESASRVGSPSLLKWR